MRHCHVSDSVLRITVGEPVELGDKVYQNTACVMASRPSR